jgi:hypothetical protein
VALETKAFSIIRARGSWVRSGLAAGGNRIRTLGPGWGWHFRDSSVRAGKATMPAVYARMSRR